MSLGHCESGKAPAAGGAAPTAGSGGPGGWSGCLEQPAEGSRLGVEVELVGWLHMEPGRECRDIRARIDGRFFYGVYGLERPDVARVFPDDPRTRCSGFLIRVRLWRGARSLVIEFLDEQNRWRESVGRTLETADLPAGDPPRPLLRAARVYDSLRQLYLHSHREGWAGVRRAADEIVTEVSLVGTEIGSEAIFRGYIENPGFWINARYDKFRVTGWAFAVGQTVRNLSAITGGIDENRLVYGKPRPDVAHWHNSSPSSSSSGFYGLVDLRTDVPSPACLRIFATLEDGSKHLVFARRLHLSRRDEHSGPVPVYRHAAFARCALAFFREACLGRVAVDSWKECLQHTVRLRRALAHDLVRAEPVHRPVAVGALPKADPYARWQVHQCLSPRLTAALRADAAALVAAGAPRLAVMAAPAEWGVSAVRALIESVRAQLYPAWECCLAVGPATARSVRGVIAAAAVADQRIRLVEVAHPASPADCFNAAFAASSAPYLAIVWEALRLPADALLHFAEALQAQPAAAVAYADEDRIDAAGRRWAPQFKAAWSPELALTAPVADRLVAIHRERVAQVQGLRPEGEGAHARDLLLRVTERLEGAAVVHVPFVVCHGTSETDEAGRTAAQLALLRVVASALQRRGLAAQAIAAEEGAPGRLRLKWDSGLLAKNPVTIVIPTRNRGELLARCLDSLARTTPRESVRVVVVDDASDDPQTLRYLAGLPARGDLRCQVVNAPAVAHGFDYSRLVNLGAAQAQTPLLLHLNNDVEALEPGWLEDMVGWASVPGVGVVGPRLLYPDGTINHAGISLSGDDRLPHPLFEHCAVGADTAGGGLATVARNVLAVTGACLLTPTALYRRLGGFDEVAFKVAYNDVDYCLRAAALGQRTVYAPAATLRHVGSASRGVSYTENEHVAFIERHAGGADPWRSAALAFPPAAPTVDAYHHAYAAKARPFRAVVVTHNLAFEGAPIFIFEYARYLTAQPGVQVRVVSPAEGPLRARFEEAGMPVSVVDTGAIIQAADGRQCRAAIARLAADPVWADTDVFICNTLVSFWAVQVARLRCLPSVLYIHESMPARRFVNQLLHARVEEVAEEVLSEATRVVFTAEATRKVHEEWNRHDRFRSLKSWVDLERIERFCVANAKADLRRKHGLDPEALLVVNIGSVCERKGQHVFVRAIDQFNRRRAAAGTAGESVQFVMVGGRSGLYMESLVQDLELLRFSNVKLIGETPEIYDFYRLADLFVCTSFEESFPRVLLESMAFRLPIVSTDVNGIPEMLVNNDEALLIPAGDSFKLVDAMERALAAIRAGDCRRPSMAYAHAARSFAFERSLPRHLAVTREALLS